MTASRDAPLTDDRRVDRIIAEWTTATDRHLPAFEYPEAPGAGPLRRVVAGVRLVSAVVVLGVALAVLALALPRDEVGDAKAALAAHEVRVGDEVVAAGLLISHDGGATFTICDVAGSRLMLDELPGCDPRIVDGKVVGAAMGVPVRGIAKSDVPGWVERDGVGYGQAGVAVGPGSEQETVVRGRWLGDAIQAESVTVADRVGEVRYVLSCPTPPGGWASPLPSGLEGEDAMRSLGEEILGHPELYGGLWSGFEGGAVYPGPRLGGGAVTVVGTVGDIETARSQLGVSFPYDLCVAKVTYSLAELRAVAERLALPDRTWQADVDVQVNRVRLLLTVLDADAVERIGDDADKVIVEALVRRPGCPLRTKEEAIAIARTQIADANAEVVWAELATAGNLDPGRRPPLGEQLVWAVGFTGSFGEQCPAPGPSTATPGPCVAMTHAIVYLDAVTGQPILWSARAP